MSPTESTGTNPELGTCYRTPNLSINHQQGRCETRSRNSTKCRVRYLCEQIKCKKIFLKHLENYKYIRIYEELFISGGDNDFMIFKAHF